MALSNAQLEEILLQKSGKKILLKPKIMGSKRLTWEDVLNRFEQGQSIGEGELLPEIPEGLSATEFYRYTGISPTLFSREPFSDFNEDIGGATPLDNEPQTIVDNTVDPSIANDARVNRISEDTWSSSDDHDPDDLSPIGYGPVNQDGFMGLLGMVPGVGTLFNLVQQDSPFKVGAAVLGEAFGGKLADTKRMQI